ncbi:hypothetical protein [Limobrevibacterium gyesilva]|uniref:Uncharacterized protein n=1 Tax=Limobrevibacterium gyesilva TaxID=2991712 RepID=A0AA41YNU3_9PROT|nr:hypothetical protein [Limobrevibacterium gyesilva]MCW3473755.1 hypothetical protein [Limobrevibacterium gyesilva]
MTDHDYGREAREARSTRCLADAVAPLGESWRFIIVFAAGGSDEPIA